MAVSRKSKGFTLVEMLVVIAIIAILAASLFPKISSAMNSARATALMTKGKGIWNAIVVANSSREPHGLSSIWPTDVKNVSGFSVGTPAYFTYLMSDEETITAVAGEGMRIASDISPDNLTASGTKPWQSGAIADENCAWRVCEVGDNDPSGLPLLITKNFQGTEISYTGDSDAGKLALDGSKKPFQNTLAVWITVGGSSQKAEPIYLRNKLVMGNNVTNVTVWACQ